mgnify:FL=1
MAEDSTKYQGRCLCGSVQFTVEQALKQIQLCHCKQCQRSSGTAFASNIPIAKSNFHIQSGADLIASYESTPGKLRKFCSRCGSPVYSERTSTPDEIRIRAGTLDGDLDARPVFHFYVEDMPNWCSINDDLPQYPQARPN